MSAVLGTYAAEVMRLARELADFGQYPPEVNIRDGKCAACAYPVQAYHGLTVLGSDERGTFAAHLHRGCAADVRRVQAVKVPAFAALQEDRRNA